MMGYIIYMNQLLCLCSTHECTVVLPWTSYYYNAMFF